MEGEIISFADAAAALKTSRAAIGKWVSDGVLDSIRKNGKRKVYSAQVVHLRDLRQKGIRPESVRDEILIIYYKVLKMLRFVTALSNHYMVPFTPIALTDAELVDLYNKASKYISSDRYDNRNFDYDQWLQVLKSIQLGEMQRLSKLLITSCPYVPFIMLCEKVIQQGQPSKYRYGRKRHNYMDKLYDFALARDALYRIGNIFIMSYHNNTVPFTPGAVSSRKAAISTAVTEQTSAGTCDAPDITHSTETKSGN